MKLTTDQRNAVLCTSHAIVNACPGSGKTRTLIAKLLSCVEEVNGTPRKIACITYTNAAVHEIEHRVRNNGVADCEGTYEISTIHVFCLNNILRPFSWKLDNYGDGFDVLSVDSDKYLEMIEDIAARYNLDRWGREKFENIGRQPNGDAIIPAGLPTEAVDEYWAWQEHEGCIDFSNIIYYSYLLLNQNPSIARTLACRFAHILVDEFQDISKLQKGIFSLINQQSESQFFLVGDPEQSIYGFAGAKPQLMHDFGVELDAEHYSLAGNYRSTASVIDCAERIISRTPRMFAANANVEDTQSPAHNSVPNDLEAIEQHFIPALDRFGIPYGNAAILATSWMALLPLGKNLRELGFPIMGPGARPYKRAHEFGRIIEPVCEYLTRPSAWLIKNIEKELLIFTQNATGVSNHRLFSYDGRRVVYRLLNEAKLLCLDEHDLQNWMSKLSQKFSNILIEEEFISPHNLKILPESAGAMMADIEINGSATINLTIADLGVFANPAKCIKLTTLHKAKGREFDAVAIIGANERKIPYYNHYNPLTVEGLDESRRLFYVGTTRAKRLLMVFSNGANRSRFIDAF